ncbi:MAG: hypothetical protein Q8K60_01155, partial [Parachlamydiaceae bacterium]|nr:hypothetical protein [Parachlamydiaceae bacterium]
QGNDSFMVELNNNTIWKCSQPKLDWQIGDNLKFDFNDEEYKLSNLQNSEEISATIISGYSKEINLPIIQEISKSGKRIVLSDASVWFSKNGRFKNWQQGDIIMISSLDRIAIDTSTHILININKSIDKENQNNTSATLVK